MTDTSKLNHTIGKTIVFGIVLLTSIRICRGIPKFGVLPVFITVDENFTVGGQLFNFTVGDDKHDSSKRISVSSNSQFTSMLVDIFQSEGHEIHVNVTTKVLLDIDGVGKGQPGFSPVELKFIARDNSNEQVVASINLYIVDINDNDPYFVNPPFSWHIKELPYTVNETFSLISAKDHDKANNGFRYSMTPNSQSSTTDDEFRNTFSIDSETGVVRLLKPLNYATNNYYQFTVTATDDGGKGRSSNEVFVIRVLDVQNRPPFFTGVPYRTSIDENVAKGTTVFQVRAQDGDTGLSNPVNITLLPGPCSKLFQIKDGLISTFEEIDRDSGEIASVSGVCVLSVKAEEISSNTSEQYGNTTSTAEVTITIIDVNDNAPKFQNQTYKATVFENTPKNVPITLIDSTEIWVSDADQGSFAEMNLYLQYPNGTNCTDFDLSPAFLRKEGSVLIRVVNSDLLDYEKIHNITIVIISTGKSNNTHSATATVSLSLIDVNDNNPHFENSSYVFYIQENPLNGSIVGTITATDEDSSEHAQIKYSLSGGNNRFVVDTTTGSITTRCSDCKTNFDREKTDVYYLTYTATDNGGRSNSSSLEIHLTDENDNSPAFTRTEYLAFIAENTTENNETAIIETQATDSDQENTNNSKIIYSIANISYPQMRDKFNINKTSGSIYLLSPLDYEDLIDDPKGVITLTIEATDSGEPKCSGTATVKINVQDINDNRPEFNVSEFHATVTENSTSNITSHTVVTKVYATDNDGTEQNRKLQYFITDGALDHFRINPSTGEISVQINARLNREIIPRYNLTLMAIDQGSPPQNGTAHVVIDLDDVNDEYPVFNKTSYTIEVMENLTGTTGEVICDVRASDPDIDHLLQYEIIKLDARDELGREVNSSLVKDFFGINPENGSVYTNTLIDREVAKTVVLTIQVNDTNAYVPSPQKANVSLTVTLKDINDNPPVFDRSEYTVNVSENAQNPTILLTISATDRDENKTISYSLNPSAFSESFRIDKISGVLSKTGFLDREENDTVTLIITATDSGIPSLNSTTKVTVHVLDFNDNAPDFGNLTPIVDVMENETIGTSVLTISATDKDFGPNKNVTYFFENPKDVKLFHLDPITGLLSISEQLDRETQPVHVLRIVARDNPIDQREQKSSTHVLHINIIDINDNAPIFEKANYTARILETASNETVVIQVSAKDADFGKNAIVHYSFNDSETNLFKIHETSGQISVNSSLIGQTGWHAYHLIAEDMGEPKMTNTSFVFIEILDVNLNPPKIIDIPPDGIIKVYECLNSGHVIYDFNYTDADSGRNAEAFFNISGIDGEDIIINKTFEMLADGSLKLKTKLNAAERSSYRFQVQVTDLGIPPLSSEKMTVTVKVIDVNDNLPSFDKESEIFDLEENKNNQIVGTVTAVDPDSDSLNCYEIEGQNSGFKVGSNNGTIVNIRPFDFETTSSVSFTVLVKDCSIQTNISECDDLNAVTPKPGEPRRDKIRVDIRIQDINDNPPVFKQKEIAIGMSRKTEVGKTLDISLKTSDYVEDNDTVQHGRQSWIFKNNGEIELSESLSSIKGEGVHDCQDNKKHIICVTGNGSLINNKYYSEDLSGYIIVPVNVSDEAGSDSAIIRIYLIADSQILIMTLLGNKEIVAERKNDIMKLYSAVTGKQFVYDWLEDHKTPSGKVDIHKTDLYFHIVDPNTNRILSSSEALKVVDENYEKLLQAMQQYDVLQIISSQQVAAEDDSPTKTIYILAAIIALLALTVAVIVYVSLTTRSTYKRKLKAATVNPNDLKDTSIKDDGFIPGSNLYCKLSNPLLNAELPQPHAEYDNISMGSNNSLDENSIGDPRKESERDGMEEREVRMDMYMEDSEGPVESPLDAALRLHDMQNKEKKGTASTDTIISPESMDNLVFENAAYVDDFESTEI